MTHDKSSTHLLLCFLCTLEPFSGLELVEPNWQREAVEGKSEECMTEQGLRTGRT